MKNLEKFHCFSLHLLSSSNRIKRERAHRERISNERRRSLAENENKNRVGRQVSSPPSDPKYEFAFHTPQYSRRESADDTGRVKGIPSNIIHTKIFEYNRK